MVRRIARGAKVTIEPHPCLDCIGLVGADSHREPHAELSPAPADSAGSSAFRCVACGVDWTCGPFGWSRLAAG